MGDDVWRELMEGTRSSIDDACEPWRIDDLPASGAAVAESTCLSHCIPTRAVAGAQFRKTLELGREIEVVDDVLDAGCEDVGIDVGRSATNRVSQRCGAVSGRISAACQVYIGLL